MNSLKPKQLLVFDALLLEQPFFELHPRHHQSRRHYFHPQNHAFHNENLSLIYFFFSSQLLAPELTPSNMSPKSSNMSPTPKNVTNTVASVANKHESMLNKPFQYFLLLNYFECHHHHWMIYRYLVILACPTLIWARTSRPLPMCCLLTVNRDIRTVWEVSTKARPWVQRPRTPDDFKWIPDLIDVFDFFLSSTFRRNDSIKSTSESFSLILIPHAGPVFWQWILKKMKFQW